MATSNPLEIMLAHDAWGTHLVLNLCRGLSHEQFHRSFEIGLGSLHDTLTHIIGAMRRWTDRLEGRTPRPMLSAMPGSVPEGNQARRYSVDEMTALHDQAAQEFHASARGWADKGLDSTLHADWPDDDGVKRYTFTRGAVIVHVCTHGMYHRAQCMNMLRRLNVPGISDALPDPSVVDWQMETELPPVRLS